MLGRCTAVTAINVISQIKADINATIGMNRLSSEVTEKLNQEKTTTNYNAPSVGSLLAVPMDQTLLRGIRFISRVSPRNWYGRRRLL
jgi:hypothetical protein